jgi:hypothetical protein
MVPTMVVYIHNMATMPVKTTEVKTRSHIDTRAPIEAINIGIVAGVVPVNRRVIIPPPVAIHYAGIVNRYINYAFNTRLNNNDFFFFLNPYMLKAIKATGSVGFIA